MSALNEWQSQISNWYQLGKHDQVDTLIPLIMHPPKEIWGPSVSLEQGKALACWLDGCLRIYQYQLDQNNKQGAYEYLNFAYAKLQAVACEPETDRELKIWALERLDQLIVALLEHCSRCHWTKECESQVESYIHFMAAQQHIRLLDEGPER